MRCFLALPRNVEFIVITPARQHTYDNCVRENPCRAMPCNTVSRISAGNRLVEERPVPQSLQERCEHLRTRKGLQRRVQSFEILKECSDVVAGIDKEWASSFGIHRFSTTGSTLPCNAKSRLLTARINVAYASRDVSIGRSNSSQCSLSGQSLWNSQCNGEDYDRATNAHFRPDKSGATQAGASFRSLEARPQGLLLVPQIVQLDARRGMLVRQRLQAARFVTTSPGANPPCSTTAAGSTFVPSPNFLQRTNIHERLSRLKRSEFRSAS